MKKLVYLILSIIVIGTLTACSLGGTPTPAPTAAPLPTPPAASPATVTGVTWEWIEFSEAQPPSVSPVPSPEKYTLIFNADGTFNAMADCNAAAGTYVVDGDMASLILGPVTLAECNPSRRSFFRPWLYGLSMHPSADSTLHSLSPCCSRQSAPAPAS